MGIDTQSLYFLKYVSGIKKFGKVATLGRQSLQVPEFKIRRDLKTRNSYRQERYCESLLLNEFGANKVDSFDNSKYEKASYLVDCNLPIDSVYKGIYDTVIDVGVLEHVYQVPQALKNCAEMLKVGGQLIHVLPANNFCGHGFWQFSPELFFSLYSVENGYEELEIFIADISDNESWYEVKKPTPGCRAEIRGYSAQYILVRAVKSKSINPGNIFQSDYQEKWDQEDALDGASKSEALPRNENISLGIEFTYLSWLVLSKIYRPFNMIIKKIKNKGASSTTKSLNRVSIKKLL